MSDQPTLYDEDELRAKAADLNLSGFLARIIQRSVPVEPPDEPGEWQLMWVSTNGPNKGIRYTLRKIDNG